MNLKCSDLVQNLFQPARVFWGVINIAWLCDASWRAYKEAESLGLIKFDFCLRPLSLAYLLVVLLSSLLSSWFGLALCVRVHGVERWHGEITFKATLSILLSDKMNINSLNVISS